MGSVATTAKYIEYWNGSLPLFVQENFKDNRQFQIADEYVVCVKEYTGKVGKYNLRGSKCVLLDGDRKIAEWKSIDNSSDFYNIAMRINTWCSGRICMGLVCLIFIGRNYAVLSGEVAERRGNIYMDGS